MQVFGEQGLHGLADADVVRVAELEIAEAYDMTAEQMELAAQRVVQSSPRFYEHLGGLSPSELRDYNQYSQHALLRPRSSDEFPSDYSVGSDYETAPQSVPSLRNPDDMMYVTTL